MKRALTLLLTLAMFVSLFAVGGIQAFAAKDAEMQYMTADETEAVLGTDGYTVVDLRKVADFEEAHIPGAVSVDMSAAVEGDAAFAMGERGTVEVTEDARTVFLPSPSGNCRRNVLSFQDRHYMTKGLI